MQDEFAGRVVGDGEKTTTLLEEELTATNVKRHYERLSLKLVCGRTSESPKEYARSCILYTVKD